MSENQKIGMACFISAVVFFIVAVLVDQLPLTTNLLVGIVIGSPVGWLCYDLREVWEKIPLAWRQTQRTTNEFGKWLVFEPHPVFFAGILVAIPSAILISYTLAPDVAKGDYMLLKFGWMIFLVIMVSISAWGLTAGIVQVLMNVGAFTLGYTRRNINATSFYRPFVWNVTRPRRRFGRIIPINYKSAPPLFFLGLVTCIPLLVSNIVSGLYLLLETFVKVVWNLVKLVHSSNRIICAIDGPIGGCLAYLFMPTSATVDITVMFMLLGGVLSVIIGIANKELIAKRLLKLA